MLEQWDYTKPLSTELKKAPLWNLSDVRLDWLIEYKRGSPSFPYILAMILRRSVPSRQIKIWNLMKFESHPDNGDHKQVEIAIFEDTMRAQQNNDFLRWHYVTSEPTSFERLKNMIREQRKMIRQHKVDVNPLRYSRCEHH